MKSKLNLFLCFVFSVFVVVMNCHAQRPGWKGERINRDGVSIVKNPVKPLFGEINLTLKEDLSIGNVDDENYLFHRVSNLAINTEGNIYVADSGNKRIQVFNNNGDYLHSIGREGQGPGEFASPEGIYLSELNGELYVPEFRSIEVFKANGDFLRAVPIESYNRLYCISPNGIIFAEKDIPVLNDKMQRRSYNSTLRLIDNKDGSETKIASFPDQLAKLIEGRSAKFSHGFEHKLHICSIGPDSFIYGFSSDYKFHLIDGTGKLLYMIEKESPQLSISKDEKDAVKERFRESPIKNLNNIPFPDYRPHYGPIYSDGDLIFVMMFKTPDDVSDVWLMDVFDVQGYYLFRVSLPVKPKVIKNGFIYLVDSSDETGDVKVRRYKIMNWSQIKNRIN